ncbi:MAG: cytochrome P450, partial [Pseudomonadota bacterium]
HESLRLHPASPVAGRQAVCPFSLTEQQDLAEGDDVVVDLFNANRDREIFGDDADAFNPHRELPNNVWPFGLTFGYGVHACLGRDLDGGVAPRKAVDPDAHQYGIVTLFIRELLRHGVRRDPDNPPQADEKTERPNWGAYPIIFETPQI